MDVMLLVSLSVYNKIISVGKRWFNKDKQVSETTNSMSRFIICPTALVLLHSSFHMFSKSDVVFMQYSPDSACNRAFLSEAAANSVLNQQNLPGGEMNPLSVCLYMCSYEAGSALCCPVDAARQSRSDLKISEGSDLYREPEIHVCCESRSDPPTMHHRTIIVSPTTIVCTAYANSLWMPWGKSSLLRSYSFPNELEVISVCNVSFLIGLMRSCDNNVALKYLLHNAYCFSYYFYSHHASCLRLLANMFISWGQSSLESAWAVLLYKLML